MNMSKQALGAAILMALSGTALAADNALAVERARALIAAQGEAARVAGGDQFEVRDVIVDADGAEHVRFSRSYQGLPVVGGDLVVHSRGGEFLGVSQTLGSAERPQLAAKIPAEQAIVNAGAEFGPRFEGLPTARLVVDARGAQPVLAYEVNFRGTRGDQTPTDMHYLVDARSGGLLGQWDRIQTEAAPATFRTLYSGNVAATTDSVEGGFELRDPSRGNGFTINGAVGRTSGRIYADTDNTWGNNALSDLASAAADAQFGVAMTWDYYRNAHGREGIANDGVGAYNRVHYGRLFGNAFWSDGCFCMTYGDGDGQSVGPFVALDIAGHEMSHGVTSRTAGLIYSGESGGLNEATSDIFGTMVEFYANNASDVPDYLIGETIVVGNTAGSPTQSALRYMFNPIADGRSPNCYTADIGTLNVHYSSGVANRFFYLLAEGSEAKVYNGVTHYAATCNGGSVSGVGRDKAGAIWYRALTVYMTESTGYAGARTATLQAATDLYGADSAEVAAVAAAWDAVDV